MMRWKRTRTMVILSAAAAMTTAWVLTGTGCQRPPDRLNAPPQGHSERPNELQDPYVHMTDNAMLEDMSMSAVHFVPHCSELNALGVRRLKRYADILKIYGGTLRYDGMEDAEALAKGRMKQIEGYLVAQGVDPDAMEVVSAMAGGAGMDANEAILVRAASNFKPCQEDSGEDGGMDLSSILGGSSK